MTNLADALLAGKWSRIDESRKVRLVDEVGRRLGKGFKRRRRRKSDPTDALGPAELIHEPSGTAWRLIPGGEFQMGLSLAEESAARAICDPPPLSIEEMRPSHKVSIEPFLMMKFPVTKRYVGNYVALKEEGVFRPRFDAPADRAAVYLSREEVAKLVEKTGFSLPTEAQWEYACRGGTETLFFFGDSLPDEHRLQKLVGPEMAASNPFGLHGLFIGEWCRDLFTPTYDSPPADEETFVIRGGASAFWPWQDCGEWAFCVSAMRMPSRDLGNGLCGARLVCSIPLEA